MAGVQVSNLDAVVDGHPSGRSAAPRRPAADGGASFARQPLKRGLMICWRKECFRSSATAQTFGVPLFNVWADVGGGKLGVIARYVYSTVKTIGIIRREKPDHVIVMNLPAMVPMAALAARLWNRHTVILDCHSGALTSRLWRRFAPLYRWLIRRAPFTINHNRQDGQTTTQWGGRPVHLVALPRTFAGIELQDAPAMPRMLVVCSFQPDEPVDVMLAAMAKCPGIEFGITGNYRKAGLRRSDMPGNVSLLGFLDYQDYLARMAGSTAIVSLSDRPHIMQMAVHEAISLGVPAVTNESETLEAVLEDAGVYCRLSADALAEGFHKAAAGASPMRLAARRLKPRRIADSQGELDALRSAYPDLFFVD